MDVSLATRHMLYRQPSMSKDRKQIQSKAHSKFEQTDQIHKREKHLSLTYSKLDLNSLHIPVYSAGSFATNEDNSSQLGYFVLLAYSINECHVLAYCSKKCKRIVRSIMATEVFVFSAAFDPA